MVDYKYLEYLFRNLPNSDFVSDSYVLDEYLPWADKVQLDFKINTTEPNEEEETCSDSA